jgi:hypothetical protein
MSVPLLTAANIGGCCCWSIGFCTIPDPACGAMVVVDAGVDDDIGELAGVVVARIAELFDSEMTLLLLFAVAICCCCFGLLEVDAGVVGVDSVGVVDGDPVVDTGVAVVVGTFTVLGILHMRASVVLTTLRLGLLGLHISDFRFSDTVVVRGILLDDDDNCCAFTVKVLARVAARGIPKVKTKPTSNVVWFILNYVRITSLYMK